MFFLFSRNDEKCVYRAINVLQHIYLFFFFIISRCTIQSEQRITAWLLFTVLHFNGDRFEATNVLVPELIMKIQCFPSSRFSGTGIDTHLNPLLTSAIFCLCLFHSSTFTPISPCAPATGRYQQRDRTPGNYGNSFSLIYRRNM